MSGFYELGRPIGESPRPLSEFFTDGVMRLLEDNIDCVVSTSWGTKNVQTLHLVDPHPTKGEPLSYHYVYESLDTSDPALSGNPSRRYGIVVAGTGLTKPGEANIPYVARKDTRRHYHNEPGTRLQVVTREEIAPEQRYVLLLEDEITNPGRLEDPADQRTSRLLKEDLARLQASTPVPTTVSLLDTVIKL